MKVILFGVVFMFQQTNIVRGEMVGTRQKNKQKVVINIF
jgi:hypothetical protein